MVLTAYSPHVDARQGCLRGREAAEQRMRRWRISYGDGGFATARRRGDCGSRQDREAVRARALIYGGLGVRGTPYLGKSGACDDGLSDRVRYGHGQRKGMALMCGAALLVGQREKEDAASLLGWGMAGSHGRRRSWSKPRERGVSTRIAAKLGQATAWAGRNGERRCWAVWKERRWAAGETGSSGPD